MKKQVDVLKIDTKIQEADSLQNLLRDVYLKIIAKEYWYTEF